MKDKTPFQYAASFCSHSKPFWIRGRRYYLPCGKCAWCRSNSMRALSYTLGLHSLSRDCLFFTLTYADECLPVFKVDANFNISIRERLDYSFARFVNVRPTSPDSAASRALYHSQKDSYIYSVINSYSKFSLPYETYERNKRDFFRSIDSSLCSGVEFPSSAECPLLLYSDVQKFFKKFRKLFKEDFTYSVTCEYGGQFKRPHFHVLLFFKPGISVDLDNFLQILCLSWGKSSKDSYELVRPDRVSGGLSRYLTTYVTTFVGNVPDTLFGIYSELPYFRQKTRHSSKLISEYVNQNRSIFYESPESFYKRGFAVFPDSPERVSLPYSSYSALCPKPYDFADGARLSNLSLFVSRYFDCSDFGRIASFLTGDYLCKSVFNSIGVSFNSTVSYSCLPCYSSAFLSQYSSSFNSINYYSNEYLKFTQALSCIFESSGLENSESFFFKSTSNIVFPPCAFGFLRDFFNYLSSCSLRYGKAFRYLDRFIAEIERYYFGLSIELLSSASVYSSSSDSYLGIQFFPGSFAPYCVYDPFYNFLKVLKTFLSRICSWEYKSRVFLRDVLPHFHGYRDYLAFCKDFYSFLEMNRLNEFYSYQEKGPDVYHDFYIDTLSPNVENYQKQQLHNAVLTKLHNNKHDMF